MSPPFEEIVHAHKLDHILPEIQAVASPAIRLRAGATGDDLPRGCSKIGGLPDLPPGSAWPVCDGVTLEFKTQIRCEDLADLDIEKRLPSTGLLSFFFDGLLTGYSTGQGMDRCAVLYTPSCAGLVPLEPPLDKPDLFETLDACRITFERILTLPPLCEVYDGDMVPMVSPLPFKSGDSTRYRKLCRAVNPSGSWLLGHPVPVQGDEIRLNLIRRHDTAGRYKYKDYHWTHEEALQKEMSSLCLLFQASSDRATGMNFGDAGRVYFWINKADLERARFENVRAILQSG